MGCLDVALHNKERHNMKRIASVALCLLICGCSGTVNSSQISGTHTVRASWYGGGEYLNRHTANGERFNSRAFTCAHRTLPFGTMLRIVRVDRKAETYCRVNDRGPAANTGRSLDLSRAAAERLGILSAGEALSLIHI